MNLTTLKQRLLDLLRVTRTSESDLKAISSEDAKALESIDKDAYNHYIQQASRNISVHVLQAIESGAQPKRNLAWKMGMILAPVAATIAIVFTLSQNGYWDGNAADSTIVVARATEPHTISPSAPLTESPLVETKHQVVHADIQSERRNEKTERRVVKAEPARAPESATTSHEENALNRLVAVATDYQSDYVTEADINYLFTGQYDDGNN